MELLSIRNALQALGHNQTIFHRGLEDSDAHFSCLIRAFMTKTNEMVERVNYLSADVCRGTDSKYEEISAVDLPWVNRQFAEFDALRRIPGFQEFLGEFWRGMPMEDILDLAQLRDKKREEARILAQQRELEAKKAEDADKAAPPPEDTDRHPDGAVIFGGDFSGGPG